MQSYDYPAKRGNLRNMNASKEARARRLDAAIAKHYDSTAEFAAASGYDSAEISRWRTGERTPKRDKLEVIAPLIHRSVDWLLVGDDPDDLRRIEAKLDLALDALGVQRAARVKAALDLQGVADRLPD